jgi:hypothetical protein
MERAATVRDPVRAEPPVAVSTTAVAIDTPGQLSWGSIWAGLLTAFGIFILLSLVGLAAGLEVAPLDRAATPRWDPTIGAIVTGLFIVLAFFTGGFMAAWTAGLADPGRATLHGFLVWALFVVLLLVLAALGIGGALGSATGIFRAFDAAAGDTVEIFREAAWGTVFALVLALAAAILGALIATRDEVRTREWPAYR